MGDDAPAASDVRSEFTSNFRFLCTRKLLSNIVEPCRIQPFITTTNLTCQNDYNLLHEEKHSFQPGWANKKDTVYSSSINTAFVYKSSDVLDTYVCIGDHGVYGSGGYVYDFRGHLTDLQGNLSQLHQLSWIDERTRAVIIQINMYTANAELFTSVTLLTEFLSTGGVFSSANIQPLSFQSK